MDRKNFIKACGFACIGGAVLSPLLQGCATADHYVKADTRGNMLVVKKAEFVKTGDSSRASYHKYVILKNQQFGFPICIYRFAADEYTALLMRCTHKGCEVKPQGDFLVCPCHGSEFTNRGVVQSAPAQENLKAFIIKTDNENIYIQV